MTTRPPGWQETLAKIHSEIRDHAWEYRHAGMWLDSMYGENAIRLRAAGPTPSTTRRDHLPSDVAIGVPDLGSDCRAVGLRKAVWDLRRKGGDCARQKSDWPEVDARRLLLIVALVTDEDAGTYAARLTTFGGLDWLSADDEQGGRETADADDILEGASTWPERIEVALTKVQLARQRDPTTRLYIALSALKVVGGYSEMFLTVAEQREQLSKFQTDSLNLLAADARQRAAKKLKSQRPVRKNSKKNALPKSLAGLEELKPVCEAAEQMKLLSETETSLYILRGLLWDGEEWVARAQGAIAEKGASALDAALSPGTMRTSIELGETLTQMQGVLDRLSVGIGTPGAVIRPDAERLAALGDSFGRTCDQLSIAVAINHSPPPADSNAETGLAPVWFRNAAWISGATKKGLDAELLRKMRERENLKKAKQINGLWIYDVREVAEQRPAYAEMLLDAVSANDDFRKLRKSEKPRRT